MNINKRKGQNESTIFYLKKKRIFLGCSPNQESDINLDKVQDDIYDKEIGETS